MPDLLTVVTSLAESAVALEQITPQFARLSDRSLLAQQARLAEARRRLDAAVAVSSAEIARRSHRDLGSDGLAQRLGARTPERLVEQVSGVSKREASTLVRVGGMLQPTPTSDPPKPWLAAIARAVQHGLLSIEAADVLRASIGEPSESVTPEALTAAVEKVLDEAATLTLDQLAARAREARDNLDAAGVADREAQRRDRRFLRLMPQWDGMVRLSGLLDPESAALVTDAFDSVTSPRRGGPRFVEKGAADRAQSILDDPRTTDQIMVDTFVEIVRIATLADPGTLFGQRLPAVRVLVSERDLALGEGVAQLEGQPASVSVATAERHICGAGYQPILIGDSEEVLKLGASRRLFSSRQRIALAVRDGGCRFPGCDRPPSWTEAHHIIHWESGGATDVDNGILLCRHHHLLVHNNGWRIARLDARLGPSSWLSPSSELWLTPPASVDPTRTPIPMPTKSAALRRLQHAG